MSQNLNMQTPDRLRSSYTFTTSPSPGHAFGNSPSLNYASHSLWNSPGGVTSPNLGTSGTSLNDSLSQTRHHYQQGYLMSSMQPQTSVVPNERFEDAPLITTKAKINPAFARGSPSDFGKESLMDSSKHRTRDVFDDENEPPTASVMDIINDVHADAYAHRMRSRGSDTFGLSTRDSTLQSPDSSQPVLHLVVFGYPSTRYSSTVAFFQSLSEGGTMEVQPSTDVENAFIIGFRQPWEAARAWRKNGETITSEGGRWMIGVKWVDAALAERVLGSAAVGASSLNSHSSSPPSRLPENEDLSRGLNFHTAGSPALDQQNSAMIGTPIKLAPSTSAFRKPGPGSGSKPSAPPVTQSTTGTPQGSKGVISQVSDLIFGW